MTAPMTPSGITRKLTDLEERQFRDERARVELERELRAEAALKGRQVENAGYWVALALVGVRGVLEMVHEVVGWFMTLRPHQHGMPWAFMVAVFCFVLPKWVGRATAGKVWGGIGTGLTRLVGRGRPAAPGEKDE
jgi:hypothetical protein